MLTFRFTGVKGEMIEKEMLVSGMVGKQVRFEFSDEWDGLRKAAVYRAGEIVCTNPDIGEIDTIPEQVLSRSLRRLYVGVYGISEDGQVAIPTRFVPGPFIHIGVDTDEDSGFDREDPFWVEMEQALEETVRFTPQTLTPAQKAQARNNIGVSGGGLNEETAALLVSLLKKAVYTEDVSDTLEELELALAESAQEPEVFYTLSSLLGKVTASPASGMLKEGESCVVTLTAADGYVLDTVTVTMGGVDITATVYSGGTVAIPSVTGNVVITAKAVEETTEEPEEPEVYYTLTCSLENVAAQPASGSIKEGESCTVTLAAATGYVLDTVTVTMGGVDITASAYSGSTVTIGSVTGNVVITAKAVEEEPEVVEVPVTLSLTKTNVSNNQRTAAVGDRYVTIFIPEDGYYLDSVKVTMNGTDVTGEVYSDGIITIPSVTGAIFVMAVALAEPAPITISEIAHGTTSFAAATGLELNRSDTVGGRATVIPTGQYLKKGSTYRFSLGGAASGYYFGVQILVASTSGLSFDSVHGDHLYFNTVTSREVDTGWLQADYTYTPTESNRIFTMNFKRTSGEFSDSHYEELMANVVIEEVSA